MIRKPLENRRRVFSPIQPVVISPKGQGKASVASRPRGGTERDPYRANVALHITGQGTNGSNAIADAGPNGYTPTSAIGAVYSTEQVKWPSLGTSLKLAQGAAIEALTYYNNRAALLIANGEAVTLRGWLYLTARQDLNFVHFRGQSADAAGRLGVYSSGGRILSNRSGDAFTRDYGPNTALNLSAWNFIQITRDTIGNLRVYINGVENGSATEVGVLGNNGGGVLFYNSADTPLYWQDLQITKGVARSNTVPAGPLPTT